MDAPNQGTSTGTAVALHKVFSSRAMQSYLKSKDRGFPRLQLLVQSREYRTYGYRCITKHFLISACSILIVLAWWTLRSTAQGGEGGNRHTKIGRMSYSHHSPSPCLSCM